jgi:hypothetical protein
MRVVMVDDSPGDCTMCRVLLEEARGPDLEFFEQGLAPCASLGPECVLLDADAPSFAAVMQPGIASEQAAVDVTKAGAQATSLRTGSPPRYRVWP